MLIDSGESAFGLPDMKWFGIELASDLSWRELARRLWLKVQSDNVFGRAAELAYFFLFSIFPLLIAMTSLSGRVSAGEEIEHELLRYFRTALPWSAYELVAETLRGISGASGSGKLSLGVAITIASGSAGMVAVIEGLNTAYDVREARSWLRRRGVSILLTFALSIFVILALAIFLCGNYFGTFVAEHVGFRPLFETAWPVIQWPLVFLFVVVALALTYRFAPNVRVRTWKWIFPGAVAAFLLWLIASAGLRLYLRFFDPYSEVYGPLGALIILMIWFYLFGLSILVGGELNSILENAAAVSGNPDAKLSGEKTPDG